MVRLCISICRFLVAPVLPPSIEEEVGSHIDGFWFLGACTLIRVSTLNCVEQWCGTVYVLHGACMSGYGYVVSITTVIRRELAKDM